jgi:hypothetical protein
MSIGRLTRESDLERWLRDQLKRPGMLHRSQIQGEKPLRTKAGVPSDADYAIQPPDGTQVIDTTNNRLYVRSGGTWRYTALT